LTLSKRRAEAVKAELMKLGVPIEALSVQWKGETMPMTQTADGVREPSNRRVEIILK
jgi:outer membrane protein OmpA-like peptidoglycan-associated protein